MVIETIDRKVTTVEYRLELNHGGGLLVLNNTEPPCSSTVRNGNGPAGEDGTASAKKARVRGPVMAGDSTSAGLAAASGIMKGSLSPVGLAVNSPEWSQVVKQERSHQISTQKL